MCPWNTQAIQGSFEKHISQSHEFTSVEVALLSSTFLLLSLGEEWILGMCTGLDRPIWLQEVQGSIDAERVSLMFMLDIAPLLTEIKYFWDKDCDLVKAVA